MAQSVTQPLVERATKKAKQRTRTVMRWVKRVIGLLVVLAFGALLVFAWLPKPIPVEIASAQQLPMVITVDEDGRTNIVDRYVIAAPLGGRMARIALRPGDKVKEGDVIARIIPVEAPLLDSRSRKTAQARVNAAVAAKLQTKAQITRARATLRFAESQVARIETLVNAGASPQGELDRAKLEAKTAEADLASLRFAAQVADHELTMNRAALARTRGGDSEHEQLTIKAPVAGRILKVFQQSEGVVPAGASLLEIGDPNALEVVVDVLTRDAVSITPGARVSLDRWGGEPLSARVRLVEPSAFTRLSALGVEEQRVNVVIDLDAPPELRDGYRVEAHIVVWETENAVQVPTSATFRHGDGWAVYSVVEGKALLATVDIGHRTGQAVEIVGGLDAGAQIILHPSDRITDGVEVVAR